jgi:carbamoyl-phosphate synthase large subunit
LGGIKIIRSAVGSSAGVDLIQEFQKRGVKVVGIDCSPLSAGLFVADKGYVVPKGDAEGFIDTLLGIIARERPQGLLTGPEEEIITISKNKRLLESKGVVTFLPDFNVARIFTDKKNAQDFFKSHGLPAAREFKRDEVENADFPLVVKPRRGRGSRGVSVVRSTSELDTCLKRTEGAIIQEKLEGVEYTVDVLNDLEGNNLSIVPRARLQVESGISTKGVTVADGEVVDVVKKITQEVTIPGPCCVQGFKTDEGFRLTEVNLRIGGGAMLSMKADPSILENIIRMASGKEPMESRGFKEGLVMLRHYNGRFVDLNNNPLSGEMVKVLKKRGVI